MTPSELRSTLMPSPREYGEKGPQRVESVYKDIKIKSTVKLGTNADRESML